MVVTFTKTAEHSVTSGCSTKDAKEWRGGGGGGGGVQGQFVLMGNQ